MSAIATVRSARILSGPIIQSERKCLAHPTCERGFNRKLSSELPQLPIAGIAIIDVHLLPLITFDAIIGEPSVSQTVILMDLKFFPSTDCSPFHFPEDRGRAIAKEEASLITSKTTIRPNISQADDVRPCGIPDILRLPQLVLVRTEGHHTRSRVYEPTPLRLRSQTQMIILIADVVVADISLRRRHEHQPGENKENGNKE
jgi:hypothetical protein